mmetsp:Transcript_21415/g.31833  ORF Transcript_21415/g.31833 Transcript_21415/m.31833 type:complete len:987 (-) Transcript_21415:81-3041(-)
MEVLARNDRNLEGKLIMDEKLVEDVSPMSEDEKKYTSYEDVMEEDNSHVDSSDSDPETDQIRCRICHSSSGVLYRPCACSGSIAYVHQECLMQWLTVKNIRQCEVCNTTYVFTPIYSTDAPRHASFVDVTSWLVEKAVSVSPKLVRCAFVLASWLILVPLFTSYVWSLCFVSSLNDLVAITDFSPEKLLFALHVGVFICFVVLAFTVVMATFRELMREEHNLAGGAGLQGDGLNREEDMLDEDPQMDDVVDELPFSTWIGFTGPIKFFFLHVTSVVLYNTVFLAVAVFIPFQAGRIVFSAFNLNSESFARWIFDRVGDILQAKLLGEAYTPTPERYSSMYNVLPVRDASLLACGYIVLMVIAAIWGPLSAFLRLHDIPFVGFIYGLLRYVITGIKFGTLVSFDLGVFPVYLGWCLDFLVLDLVDATWDARKKFFHGAPVTSMAMHWFLGINFILYISFIASLLRQTIKRSILSRFLRYPDDPDFQPFHDFIYVPLYRHCKRLCVSALLYTILVILCIHIPAKIFTKAFPSVAPLRWKLSDRTELPADLLLFYFFIPAIVGHVDLRSICLEAVKGWFLFVSKALGLDAYLLIEEAANDAGVRMEPPQPEILEDEKKDEQKDEQKEVKQQEPVLKVNESGPESNDELPHVEDVKEHEAHPETVATEAKAIPRFTLKVFLLILSSWAMHTIVLCACVLVPVVLGRLLLRSVNATFRHDLYAVVVGLYAYLGSAVAGGRVVRYLREHGFLEGVMFAVKWISWVCRYIFLGLFIMGILPLLAGILFDLTIVIPLRIPLDESPRIFLERDWMLGIILIKVWFQLLLSGVVGNEDVKGAVHQLLNDPENMSVEQTMRRAILPYLHSLLWYLSFPYTVCWGIIPSILRIAKGIGASDSLLPLHFRGLGEDEFTVEVMSLCHMCYRYSFAFVVLVEVSRAIAGIAADWYVSIKQSMIEERYLIGKRLHNFGEAAADNSETAPNESEVSATDEEAT